MRVRTSLPTHTAFFEKYAVLLPTLQLSTIVANIISAATEIFVIFTMCHLKLLELAPQFAFEVSVLVAILGTFTIELGLRRFCPFVAKAILFKRFEGLELLLSIFVFIICFILILTSALLSYKGSFQIVNNLTADFIEETDVEINNRRAKRENMILNISEKESLQINQTFKEEIEAIEESYALKIQKEQNLYRKYKNKEIDSGKSFKSKKARIKEQIDLLKVEKAEKIALLKSNHNMALQKVFSIKNKNLDENQEDYANDKQKILERNQKGTEDRTNKIYHYGLGLGYFTLACLFVFIISTIIIEIIKKGSGIEDTPTPSSYFFKQGILSEAFETGKEHVNRLIFGLIRSWSNTIKPPLLPSEKEIPILFNYDNLSQPKVQIASNQDLESTIFYLPSYSTNYSKQIIREKEAANNVAHENQKDFSKANLATNAIGLLIQVEELKKANLIKEADKIELKADQVIKMYLGKGHTQDDFIILKNSIIGYLKGENENPFQQHHRKPIVGFKNPNKNFVQPEKNLYDSRITAEVIDSKLRSCHNCHQEYIYKQWNQKFCSEKCRIQNWQQKTGRQLRMKKRKK